MARSLFADPRPLDQRKGSPTPAPRRGLLRESDVEWMERYGYDFNHTPKPRKNGKK